MRAVTKTAWPARSNNPRVRLFHFSHEPDILTFEPRTVAIPSIRREAEGWLNGPLVWAIDEWHQPMYLFPRDCPRILLLRTKSSTRDDIDAYWQGSDARMIAYAEREWEERVRAESIFRYELPAASFEDLKDAGMWVSRGPVEPLGVELFKDLPAELAAQGVELRFVESLAPLKAVWDTSLHASGIRLRNASIEN
jgi:hypothetical protein